MREVAEETGLAPEDFDAEPGWITVLAGARIAQIKLLQARDTAAALAARIRAHLASAGVRHRVSDPRVGLVARMEPKARLRASSTRYGEIRDSCHRATPSRIALRSMRATVLRIISTPTKMSYLSRQLAVKRTVSQITHQWGAREKRSDRSP